MKIAVFKRRTRSLLLFSQTQNIELRLIRTTCKIFSFLSDYTIKLYSTYFKNYLILNSNFMTNFMFQHKLTEQLSNFFNASMSCYTFFPQSNSQTFTGNTLQHQLAFQHDQFVLSAHRSRLFLASSRFKYLFSFREEKWFSSAFGLRRLRGM